MNDISIKNGTNIRIPIGLFISVIVAVITFTVGFIAWGNGTYANKEEFKTFEKRVDNTFDHIDEKLDKIIDHLLSTK